MADDVIRAAIPKDWILGKRLGRHVLHDPRSRAFPADRAATIRSVDHHAKGLPLNQGQIGSCTANALCGALNSAPDSQHGTLRNETDAVSCMSLRPNSRAIRILPMILVGAALKSARLPSSLAGSRRTRTRLDQTMPSRRWCSVQ